MSRKSRFMKLPITIGAALAIVLLTGAAGPDQRPVKIGVLTDMTSIYAEHAGPGSVEAARMAIEDFGGSVLGKPIELVFADHRNDTGLGMSIARRWYGEGVDALADVGNSAVARQWSKFRGRPRGLSFFRAPLPPNSPARTALPTPSTGHTTPMPLPTEPPTRS